MTNDEIPNAERSSNDEFRMDASGGFCRFIRHSAFGFHSSLGISSFVIFVCLAVMTSGGSLEAPPGLFKDLDETTVGDAVLLDGRQLFVDGHLIESMDGLTRKLNQPEKHASNPLVVVDKPWEERFGFSSVMYDREEGFYKMWYGAWSSEYKKHVICYATSPDGVEWRKHLTTPWGAEEHTNIVFGGTPEFNCAGVFKDPVARDPMRRYKMLYSEYPDGTAATASSGAAFSPDGIHWTACEENPLIPFSDSHLCPFWDPRRGRYVAYLRYGPPNTRAISMVESEDFVHWSPKVTLFAQGATPLDAPRNTKLYQMEVFPYEKYYFGLISTYHGETIQPIPPEREAWADKSDVQLTYSRNGRTWRRVGGHGAFRPEEFEEERDWEAETEAAVFIPWGSRAEEEWDWGSIYPLQAPVVIGDEIRFYYVGMTGRHWASYHGDDEKVSGIGLATLRLDGFVSVEGTGTLTTRPLVFLGDGLDVNADADGGSIRVEALDPGGEVVAGFSKEECEPISADSVRHVLKWKGSEDCHQIQGKPIQLRFHLQDARLFSFTPRILKNHYVPSYD
jgi:hypothetical protein